MYGKKKTKDYVKILAKNHGLTQKQVKKLLNYHLKNVMKTIKHGNDIRIQGFGKIYFNKSNYSQYLKAIDRNGKNRDS